MSDRTPPQDLDAERSVLGGMMLRNAVIDEVVEHVQGSDFYRPAHEALFDAIVDLHRRAEPADPVTVAADLTQRGALEKVGGAPYLITLISTVPTAANAGYYARIVREKAILRGLVEAGTRIVQLGYANDGYELAETVENARAEVDAVTARATTGGQAQFIGDTIDDTLEALDHESPAIPTPWGDLNHLIQGWRPGGLYVIGARPSVGKSIIAVQAAIGLAKHGTVAFSSLEMPRNELETRIIAHIAEVPTHRMDSRQMTEDDWARIARHRGALADLPLAIDDRSYVTATDIRSHARTVSRKGPLAAIVVDYLQLLSAPRGDKRPRHEVVAGFSRDLKLLAKEMAVPVIALSQLNRGPEQRQDKRPTMADLRESGAVEQDADVILLLHADDEQGVDIDMLVAKNRQGAQDIVRLTREGWYSRMTPRAWKPSHAQIPPAPDPRFPSDR